MIGRLLLWARRNSRKALAFAVAPGLVALAFDAAIAHWAGKDFDNKLQAVPVVYGLVGFVFVSIACIPRSRALFAWTARLIGGTGVLVGLAGTGIHLAAFIKELGGQYSAASFEGAFSVAPPLLAPLGFAGVGALLFFLPSARLLFRLRVGSVPSSAGRPLANLEAPSTQAREDEVRKKTA
jgi:hypothetical protein